MPEGGAWHGPWPRQCAGGAYDGLGSGLSRRATVPSLAESVSGIIELSPR